MEPISVVASVLSIAKASTSIAKATTWIRSLKHVPLEVIDLNNELEVVRGYLAVLEPYLASVEPDQKRNSREFNHVATTIQLLQDDLGNLRQLMEAILTPSFQSSLRISSSSKIKWRRHKGDIAFSREKVRRRKCELAQAVTFFQQMQNQATANLLLDVCVVWGGRPEEPKDVIGSGDKQAELAVDEIFSPRTNNMWDPAGPKESQESNHNNSLGRSTQEAGRTTQVTEIDSRLSPDTAQVSSELTERRYLNLVTKVRHKCSEFCCCQCHVRRELQGVTTIAFVIGQFLLSYSSIPIWDPRPCDYSRCQNMRFETAQLHYIFPEWFAKRALVLSASWGGLVGRGASLHLRVARVLPYSHEVWKAIELKDTSCLWSMLQRKEILPTDIGPAGTSLFLHALRADMGKESREFLFPVAADQMESNGISPFTLSQQTIICFGKRESNLYTAQRKILAIRGYENDNSIPVHTTTLEDIRQASVKAVREQPGEINSRNIFGAAPLHWAAIRNDRDAVRFLLGNNADIDVQGAYGCTPLFLSITFASVESAFMLLNAGADVNHTNKNGDSCLSESLAISGIPASVTAMLLDLGADKKHKTSTGLTPLHQLVRPIGKVDELERTKKLDLLLAAALDINEQDFAGRSPLLSAIQHDDTQLVKTLLERGADVGLKDICGKSALHYAGLYATWRTFEALEGHLHTTDPELETLEGMTTEDYFQERLELPRHRVRAVGPLTEKDVAAFETFMSRIRELWRRTFIRCEVEGARNDCHTDDEDRVEEKDEFHDALESLHDGEALACGA